MQLTKIQRDFDILIGKKVKRLLLLSMCIGGIVFLVESSFVFLIQGFFVSLKLFSKNQTKLPDWYPLSDFWPIYLLIVGTVIRSIVLVLRQYLAGVVKLVFLKRLKSHILVEYVSNASSVKLSNVLVLYSERIGQASTVVQNVARIIMIGFSGFLLFGFGLKIAHYEMLFATFFSFVVIFLFKKLGNAIQEIGDSTRVESRKTLDLIVLGFKQNFLLLIYGQLANLLKVIQSSIDKHKVLSEKYILLSNIRAQLPNLIGVSVLCFTTVISLKINSDVDSSEIVSFFYIFIRFAQSMSEGNKAFSEIRMQKGAYNEVLTAFKELNNFKNPEVEEKQIMNSNVDKNLTIEMKNVFFRYTERDNIISNMNIRVCKGDVLLIKGRTGSGKSTLIKLLTGIEDPSDGSIEFAGGRLKENLPVLRSQISYVGPEPFIIHGSIKENVLFGNHRDPESIKDEEIFDLIKFVRLEEEIKDLDYQVSEMSGLSTGQKQRLSLVRALLRNPNIIILDEATANLDRNTELEIINNLKTLTKEKILIIVSHKDTFDSLATKSIDLDSSERGGVHP